MQNMAIEDLPPDFDLVRIRGLTLPFFIGIHEFERFRPQNVRIDVDMAVGRDVRARGEYVSYAVVCDHAVALSAGGDHIELVETLAALLLAKALEDPRVARARVTVLKSDIYPQAEGVGVTIEGVQGETVDGAPA